MNVDVRDAKVLKSVTPLEVATYLRASGWSRESQLGDKAIVWQLLKNNESHELLVPLRSDLGDYSTRISEILEVLSQITKRSQLQILFDLSVSNTDVVRVRAAADKYESGTIGIIEGAGLIEHSKEMMLAAASSAVQKQAVFSARKPQQAVDYLNNVRLGQTERGSFVLTLLSPVAPQLNVSESPTQLPISDLEGTEENKMSQEISEGVLPFARQVTQVLAYSLWQVQRAAIAANNSGNLDSFKDSVADGVTSNLCDAVVGLYESSGQSDVDVSFAWSRGRIAPTNVPKVIHISSEIVSIVQDASKMFREKPPPEPVKIQGFVAKLSRPRPNARGGEITIHGFIKRDIFKVRVPLNHDDYQQAVVAHEKYKPVSCQGELAKNGNLFRFLNPERFEVLDAVDFDAGAFGSKPTKAEIVASGQTSLDFDV